MNTQRIFAPGSEWVYLKIYSGPKIIEKLLVQEFAPILASLEKQGFIDQFFFLRYTDPDYHLRIRLHLTDTIHIRDVLREIQQAMQTYTQNRFVWKYTIDTYARELERYGNTTIAEVESLFCSHSRAALVLAASTDTEIKNDRWLWACRFIDMVLDQFEYNSNDKIVLWSELSDAFLHEFNADKKTRVSLDIKFRANKHVLETVMTCNHDDNGLLQRLIPLAESCKEPSQTILSKRDQGTLEIRLNSLLGSIIHMHFNRVFRTQQRMYELVIYYLMNKYHTSKAACNKYTTMK